MKIAVNTQHLLKDRLEGLGNFAHETLSRITRSHPEHEFFFIFDRPWDESFIYSDNITPIKTRIPSRHPFLWWWHYQIDTRRILKKINPDVFFSPDGWIPTNTNIPTVDVIHDVNFMHRPEDFPFFYRKYFRKFFPAFAREAEQLITVSEYSKKDICESFRINPGKVKVVYNGCSTIYQPLTRDVILEVRRKFTEGHPYFVYVGSRNPRKNIEGLLKAFDEFKMHDKKGYKLLFVGEAMWQKSYLSKQIQEMNYKNDLVFTGRLSNEVLHLVMASASTLTLVSFLEGFGIPVVEAMHCDVPVICSNVTSLPEIAGDAALFVDPSSVSSISNAMTKIATSDKLRDELVQKGREQRIKFSWDNTAARVWDVIENTIKS